MTQRCSDAGDAAAVPSHLSWTLCSHRVTGRSHRCFDAHVNRFIWSYKPIFKSLAGAHRCFDAHVLHVPVGRRRGREEEGGGREKKGDGDLGGLEERGRRGERGRRERKEEKRRRMGKETLIAEAAIKEYKNTRT